jgi:uncharacterized protein YcbX
MPVLTSIHVYPVKSLAGMSPDSWPLGRRGLEFDRRWMLVDENGRFISQRESSSLAMLQAEVGPSGLKIYDRRGSMQDLIIPMARAQSGAPMEVTIWKDTVTGLQVGMEVDRWFQEALDRLCFLVYMPESTLRAVDPTYAQPEDVTGFSDGFPFLIAQQASLDDLNRRLSEPVEMRRFRPNLVISGGNAWEEDTWERVQIGANSFRTPKPCARCEIITIDPGTGEQGKEPLRTLAGFRQWNNKVLFGANACLDLETLENEPAIIRVGDSFAVRS